MSRRFFIPDEDAELVIPPSTQSEENLVEESNEFEGLSGMIPEISREDMVAAYHDLCATQAKGDTYIELGLLYMMALHLDLLEPDEYHHYPEPVKEVMLPRIQSTIHDLWLMAAEARESSKG